MNYTMVMSVHSTAYYKVKWTYYIIIDTLCASVIVHNTLWLH